MIKTRLAINGDYPRCQHVEEPIDQLFKKCLAKSIFSGIDFKCLNPNKSKLPLIDWLEAYLEINFLV